MQYANIERHKALFSEYTELRVQENRSVAVGILNGDIVRNARNAQGGMSARVFKNGLWGFASTPESDDEAIRQAIRLATDNARFLGSKAGQPTGALPARPGIGQNSLATTKPRLEQKAYIDFLRDVDAYAAAKYPYLKARTLMLSGLDMEKTVLTADGGDAWSLIARSLVYASFTMEENGEPVDLYEVIGGPGQFEDIFDQPSALYPKIDLLADRLRQKAKGVYAKPGEHEVVLDSDLAGILAHEAIGHTVEADLVLGGSVAADYMNQAVASPLVTMVDFANTAYGKLCPVPLWIDDEGTAAKDAVLIKDGVLKSYMHNKESARHFSADPTGNARAYGFYDEPLIRMRNTAILPGSSKLADMIASVDKGYYFLTSSNGQADSTSEFMFGVVMGYEINNGKLGAAVRDCTISGIAFNMLKTVTMVSDDMSWTGAGMCGKKQSIPVGMGGPAIKCRINVGGRA
ncbi:MAG: peptidase [Spirochaetes bacterium GWD1_61_31]|nr:MAG: peptidase [Spirochaetes bacterium GWB1_60_80]OHD29073.1 MAG: peptidase [Spirochaetes bacterium GWC1_61_12]OHD43104.1 MAG: peptidase [Spirochaetes bacterium GWD1_61_31]OHD44238.1 MAG: peptidase [Spirochaetes bacterium GWE1_60_18]OHD60402.1 MAG: peptidase [Spirochaetes bacterium GWF1_60_12]HAP43282.1 peptidase [Spirochaetaceae bacterium]